MKWRVISIVLVLCTAVAGQEQKSVAKPSVKDGQKTANKTNESKPEPSKAQCGTEESPCTVKIVTSEADREEAAKKAKAEESKASNDTTLTVATIFLAIFTALLWLATWKLAKDSKDAANSSIAIAKTSADAAKESADYIVNSERAWIAAKVENFELPGIKEHPPFIWQGQRPPYIWVRVSFRNAGKTAAKIKRVWLTKRIVEMNSGGRPENLPMVPEYNSDSVQLGGLDLLLVPETPWQDTAVELNTEDLINILERKKALYVYGIIAYTDTIKGETHETHFCELYWVPGRFDKDVRGFTYTILIPPKYLNAT